VIRLYQKNEMSYATSGSTKYFDKVRQQYEYARENIDSLRKSAGLEASSKGTTDDLTNIFVAKLFEFVKKLIYLVAAFLIFTMIFKSFDNKSFLENYKFDIKKAKEIH